MMNVFIDKLERLMNEFKNESVNPNEDEAKGKVLFLLYAMVIKPLGNISI